jgi:hypothetical protein
MALGALLLVSGRAPAETNPPPSENGGSARQAIHAFVRPTTDTVGPQPPQAWEHAHLLAMWLYSPKPLVLNGRWRPSAVEHVEWSRW